MKGSCFEILIVCGIVAFVIAGQLRVSEFFTDVRGKPLAAIYQHCGQCGDPLLYDPGTHKYICSSGPHE
jgi:hypothetical protein